MKTLGDVISKYVADSEDEMYELRRGITTKISMAAMLKLEAIAAHFDTKKTPLAGELLEGAINEVFDQVSDGFEDGLHQHYAEQLHELENLR